jgi:hypothetical protein
MDIIETLIYPCGQSSFSYNVVPIVTTYSSAWFILDVIAQNTVL